MTSVSHQSFDPFKAIGNAFDTVADAVGRECGRIVNEVVENIGKDASQIANGVKNGGLLGGVVEFADVMSPGHQLTNLLDATNVIPENKALQEGLSAAVNLLSGNVLPGLKDLADAVGALPRRDCRGPGAQPNAPQAPQHPRHASQDIVERAREAIERLSGSRGHSHDPRTGWCPGIIMPALPFPGVFPQRPDRRHDDGPVVGRPIDPGTIRRWPQPLPGTIDFDDCKPGDRAVDDAERKMMAELKRILNNPCLDFEDMIFYLMRAVIKGTQAQVRAMASSITTESAGIRKARASNAEELSGARGALRKAEASGDTTKSNQADATVSRLEAKQTNALEERVESRNEKMEEMKNILQKLSEMQQMLSNILNTQHETAMAAVRAIR